MKINREILLVVTTVFFMQAGIAQGDPSRTGIVELPGKLFSRVERKAGTINTLLSRKQQRLLQDLTKQENKLKRKLAKKNPTAAKNIFGNSSDVYRNMDAVSNQQEDAPRGSYMPYMDSLTTAMRFIDAQGNGYSSKAKNAAAKLVSTNNSFNSAKKLTGMIEERKKYLQEQLSQQGLGKQFEKYKKQLYYYKAQVKEYQNLFRDPSQVEAKALSLLRQTSAYQEFFQRHSQLAQMFGMASTNGNAASTSLSGLTTRAGVQQVLMQRFGSAGLPQQVQQQLASAHSALKQMKEKAEQLGESKGEADPSMPNFKPNNQKTKRFADRLELGTNLQTTKANGLLPAASDFGASVGYKLNDKSIVGVGGSYKMGWGPDIRHVRISHQGMGARSFLEYKLKGNFWLTGGFEMNYLSAFKNLEILQDFSAWQQSALTGITKKYRIGPKMKGNLQLLYDFLHVQQKPRTQPIIFRFGYSFK